MRVCAAAVLLMVPTAAVAEVSTQVYPAHMHVVDVTKPPYLAKGDGVSDDTDALQQALNENVGRHRVLYFPKGTYLVSRTLTWPKKFGGRENWGFTMLRGQQRDTTVLRLKDGCFTDAAKPEAIMWCGGFGSADWFHNYVENLTFDVGTGNPARPPCSSTRTTPAPSATAASWPPRAAAWWGLTCASRYERTAAGAALRGHRFPAGHCDGPLSQQPDL